ncbi:MAG: intermembrane transport protein PqiB [Candidatus Binataceae bacterium]
MSTPEQPGDAVERQSHWPGWIWAIPVAALGIVIWLGVRSWSSTGPKVTVIFPSIINLKPGDTEVKFQGMVVGNVKSVHIEKDFQHMRVELELDSELNGHLGSGTKFWIEGKGFSLSNLSDIAAIVSGAYISMKPAPGNKQDQYIGLTEPPVLKFGEQGTPFILHTETLSGIHHGTPIYYLDEKVGEVRTYKMIGYHGFDVTVMVKAPFDKLVHAGTRFWNASAVHFSNGVNGPKLQLRSLPAMVEGAIAFETPPGPAEGSPSRRYDRFKLYDGKDTAENAPDSEGVSYRVVFTGTSNSLGRYAPVQLMGSRVGSVSEAKLEYSPATGKMSISATIVIEPSRIQLANGEKWSNRRRQMDSMMQRLVAQGLRAELSSSPPVIGGHMVVLRTVPGKNGVLIPGDIPEIPTSSGSDVSDIIATAGDVATKVDEIPLPQIAHDVRDSTSRIAALVNSPDVRNTLHSINNSAANVEKVTAEARDQLPPAIRSARQSVAAAEATLTSAQALLSANPALSNQPQSAGVPEALYELTRAARSLRELSDFLDRHPEALIEGRGVHQ